MRIFHIATQSDWDQAQRAGSYATSTLGQSLAEVGFIHASRGDQWQGVRDLFYSQVDQPLVLLTIDTDLLRAPVVDELDPESGQTFPHIYGLLNVDAVVQVVPLSQAQPDPGVATSPAPATAPAPSLEPINPQAEFSKMFIRLMVTRALVGLAIIVAAAVVGVLVDNFVNSDLSALAALATLVAGCWTALRVSKRPTQHGVEG